VPPVLPPVNEAVFAQIGAMRSDIRAMQTQQQQILSNLQGQPIMAFGLQPGSNPAQYGLGVLNKVLGTQLAFFGEDDAGNVGLYYYNTSGQKVSQYDGNGLHFYDTSGIEVTRLDAAGFHSYDTSGNEVTRTDATGLHVYNSSGTEEVAAGLIAASLYGLAVLPYGASTMQQVAGTETSAAGALSNTTVTTWTVPTGASTLTMEIGPSGAAQVNVSGQCSTGTGGQEAFIGCLLDGSTVPVQALVSSGTGGVSLSTSKTKVITGLTANTTHTFEPVVETAANGSNNCSFSDVTVTITPL
jgi:hypothetical protein